LSFFGSRFLRGIDNTFDTSSIFGYL